jgi:hypothetical protein
MIINYLTIYIANFEKKQINSKVTKRYVEYNIPLPNTKYTSKNLINSLKYTKQVIKQ